MTLIHVAPHAVLQDSTALWTDQLVRDLQHSPDRMAVAEVDDWTPRAGTGLRDLFAHAALQANEAFAASGLADRLVVEARGTGWRLTLEEDEEGRELNVHPSLRLVRGHVSGGAQITTSMTRATIYLVPVLMGTGPCWIVSTTGSPFTVCEVGDLLLSTFGDDGAATTRLLPCFSLGDSI